MIRKVFGILLIALALTISGSASTFRSYTAEREVKVGIGDDPLIDVQCLDNGSIMITNNINAIVYLTVKCKCRTRILDPLIPGDSVVLDNCHKYRIEATWDGGGAVLWGHCHHNCCRSCKG